MVRRSPRLNKRRKRCPNGSRRNLKTMQCEKKKRRLRSNSKYTKRCPNESRRKPPKTGQCVKNKKRKSSRRSSRTLTLPDVSIRNTSRKSSSRRTSSRRRSLKL